MATDYGVVMQDVMRVWQQRDVNYRVLVKAGHRKRDDAEESILRSLRAAAELCELEAVKRRQL